MMRDVWVFPFLFLFSAFLMILRHHSVSASVLAPLTRHYNLSHSRECDALLQLGNSFIIADDASGYQCDELHSITSYPTTSLWKNGTNCCSWDGVTCHTSTNHVIGLDLSCSWLRGAIHSNSTLFLLRDLQWLSLAGNDFYGSQISPKFGSFIRMTHLDLSGSSFQGIIPLDMISRLSKLVKLSLSDNYDLTVYDDHSFRWLIRNLTQLGRLFLDGVNMSTVSPVSLTNLSSTLTSLSLYNCSLRGVFPINIFHLPNLHRLSLSLNSNLTGTLPQTNWSGPLVSLGVRGTKFHGPIPMSVGNLTSMYSLDLSNNQFTGSVPPTLGNLYRLSFLILGGINLSLDFEIFAKLKNLEFLQLSQNLTVMLPKNGNCSFPRLGALYLPGVNLTEFPYFLSSSEELVDLYLSRNMITGQIPEWIGRVGRAQLASLELSSNNFTGEIPSSICQLSSLQVLDLSHNGLNGTIPICLGNLSSLQELYLDNNLFQGPLPRSLANCTSLAYFVVHHNGIYDTLPHWWLNATLNSLEYLDLQSNKFHGVINEISLPPTLHSYILSNNQFSGQLPINFFRNSRADFIDLANNNFDGPLPIPPPTVLFYSISNNKFSGEIPHQLCSATRIEIINLSNNSLTSSIPHCFINLNVSVLDLRENKLVGQIPEIFVPENNLRTIRLCQNRLGGTLPRSLANCKNLEVLDLSINELEGHFPYWLDTLPNLQVLNLRSNKLSGLIKSSKNNQTFPKLHIFDLSDNCFYGPLPASYIANFIAMKDEVRSSLQYMRVNYSQGIQTYQDSVTVVLKGVEIKLVRILTMFTAIDFSQNLFEGEIPELIGDLKALKGLNLSHNNLTGNTPSSMGNLTNLEWLDLSSNKLSGEIPRGLADLSSLSYLNLSNNQLVGPIPRSTQFDTFNHSFDGNPRLCGHPLSKACGTDVQQSPPSTSPGEREEDAESWHWIEWRAVPMGFGCGLALGISAWFIMWETLRPRWLVRMIERKIYRMTKRKKKNQAPRNHSRYLFHDVNIYMV
ncbi:receptor-like protein Cf-9 [Punica granatum]|uniref:Receptor-like protein Cf-9 n=1 Tax=Punica granatum TaxID=22663 RepID=A0A6P8BTD1_PUNGR|nr:receptor-like protein Cf-9 [Punica granatum]